MKKLLIDILPEKTITLLTENDKPVEFFIDTPDNEGSWVGRIVVGRIKTILPGQIAFVDIGAKKNAFINLKKGHGLKAGQSILVQVQKDATGTKGMNICLEISIKGRFIVLCSSVNKTVTVGISRKIKNEKEARRLRKIVWKSLPTGFSAIVRTNAENKTSEDIKNEIEELHKIFVKATAHAEFVRPPAILFPPVQNTAITKNLLSDILSENIDEIHINTENEENFTAVKNSITNLIPSLEKNIFQKPLNLQKQIKNILKKEVRLPSGGFITIEQTEACVVIDVNTGSYVGNTDYSTTVFETNVQAATEIAAQIRLRNLSGIIIVDFIDMPKEHDKTALLNKLTAEINKDRLKTEIAGFVGLGMVLLTRRRIRPPLSEYVKEKCPVCGGLY